jgi:hypothetical protein
LLDSGKWKIEIRNSKFESGKSMKEIGKEKSKIEGKKPGS